ncbi:hypothetical protein SAMN05660284_02006 [Formivibrio citricus]|uniref:Uncharacterized protein n=1 Tax=Formivibrio citricus TaxID=83765 RepID=A0A1I5AVK0_9NEIS|nr:hypothetical protein [Formivibrio citricus]SFN66432.1 hypothetical protein SAMN05660284_02006 [Formivibrio citricus]
MMLRLAIVFSLLLPGASFARAPISDTQIKQQIIKDSLANYPGNCPCPYNTDRAGRNCGKRSAYSKPGGYAPLCYPKDVTQEMVEEWKKDNIK